jgi:hypothetical protein
MKVLFNPSDHFERYNGGWTKTVEGIDKGYTNGYSIIGEFTEGKRKDWYNTKLLYLDCGIGGSRKNQKKFYTLFTIDENGNLNIVFETYGSDWATDLWPYIESFYNSEKDNSNEPKNNKLLKLKVMAAKAKLKLALI